MVRFQKAVELLMESLLVVMVMEVLLSFDLKSLGSDAGLEVQQLPLMIFWFDVFGDYDASSLGMVSLVSIAMVTTACQ